MPFEVIPEPNEEVILIREFRMKNADPFAIAVSTHAIYLPAKKIFAARDPWHFRKVPLSAIKQISLETLKPVFLYLLSQDVW